MRYNIFSKNLIKTQSGCFTPTLSSSDNYPLSSSDNYPLSSSDNHPLSSSCLTRGSMNKDIILTGCSGRRPSMTRMISQSGRSMVEMLGVLAIIGVLSVGGITGYSYAMNKHKANQTINEINLRRIDLIQQQQMGLPLNLSAWKDEETIYPIDVYHNDLLGGTAIVIDEVPSKICKIIGDVFKEKATVFIGSETFDENSNEENDPCNASDKNTIELYFDGIQCDPSCGENEYCDNGWCFKTTGTPKTGSSKCGGEGAACTTENGQDGFCESDTCLPLGTCTSNEECGPKEYCGVVNYTNSSKRFPSGATGTCVKANFLRYEIDDTIYYVSATGLNWWNAEAACAKIGKEHLQLSDLLNITGKNLATATDLSIKLSKIIGAQYVWVVPEKNQSHMWTPQLAKDYLDPAHEFNYDMKQNNHARVAVCK